MFGEQPQLLLTAPSAVAARPPGGGPGLRSVTVLELLWEHGVLVTGHAKGEVRVLGMLAGEGRVTGRVTGGSRVYKRGGGERAG